MANDLLDLTTAIAGDEPCGPDLDLTEDDRFVEYMALAEGKMPASFFTFDKSSISLTDELEKITELLSQSRDLRLLVMAAKFSILSGNIVEFANALEAMAILVKEQWEHVHPQGEDGDFQYRLSQPQSLDDMVSVVLPLQYAPLVISRRHGKISWRNKLVADGAATAKEDEETVDAGALEDAISQEDDIDAIVAVYDAVNRAAKALKSIAASFSANAGPEQSTSYRHLGPLLDDINKFLTETLASRDPTLVEGYEAPLESEETSDDEETGDEEQAQTVAMPVTVGDQPPLVTVHDARNAMAAIEQYFSTNEPSNPAVLVIRQAQQLIGKSFVEAMEVILPGQIENTIVHLGGGQSLQIPLTRLRDFAATGAQPANEDEAATYCAPTRADAIHLIDAIEKFYRQNEPSSPIPLLLSRTKHYSNKDFATLIKDLVKVPAPEASE